MGITVLIVGGGGREHALLGKLRKAPALPKSFALQAMPALQRLLNAWL